MSFGDVGGGVRALIRREVDANRDTITGTVIAFREMVGYDTTAGGAPVWVANVEIGQKRFLRNVPVRSIGKSLAYADVGRSVQLRRTASGRYEVVGPGDRVAAAMVIKTYNLTTGAEVTSTNQGFSLQILPFEFYKGPTPGTPGTSLWATGLAFPYRRTVDADGNPVP